jgi:hypothetical protein
MDHYIIDALNDVIEWDLPDDSLGAAIELRAGDLFSPLSE